MKLRPAVRIELYDDSEPRDSSGRWTGDGSRDGGGSYPGDGSKDGGGPKQAGGSLTKDRGNWDDVADARMHREAQRRNAEYADKLDKAHKPTLVGRIRDYFAKKHADAQEADRQFHEFFDSISPNAWLSEDAHGHEHAPAGSPEGGQFVSKGGGAGGGTSDHSHEAKELPPRGLHKDEQGNAVSHKLGAPPKWVDRPLQPHDDPGKHKRRQARMKARYEAAQKRAPEFDAIFEGPEQPGENLQRVTKQDTPELMRARQAYQAYKKRWQAENGLEDTAGINTPEREHMRDSIAKDLYGAGSAQKERKAYLVTGGPGTGKSTHVKKQGMDKWLEIDSDQAKEQLPEFNGGLGADLVHNESSGIADKILERALEAGDNVVLPMTGKNPKNLDDLINKLKAAGYAVKNDLITMPTEDSAESVTRRFHTGSRLVSPEFAHDVNGKPLASYMAVKQNHPDVEWGKHDAHELFAKYFGDKR